jgi:hypothetical protein
MKFLISSKSSEKKERNRHRCFSALIWTTPEFLQQQITICISEIKISIDFQVSIPQPIQQTEILSKKRRQKLSRVTILELEVCLSRGREASILEHKVLSLLTVLGG